MAHPLLGHLPAGPAVRAVAAQPASGTVPFYHYAAAGATPGSGVGVPFAPGSSALGGPPPVQRLKTLNEFVSEYLTGPCLISGAPQPAIPTSARFPFTFLRVCASGSERLAPSATANDVAALELTCGRSLPSPIALSRLVGDQQWAMLDELVPPLNVLLTSGGVSPSIAALAAVASSSAPTLATADYIDSEAAGGKLSVFGALGYSRCRQAALMHRGKTGAAAEEAAAGLAAVTELLEAFRRAPPTQPERTAVAVCTAWQVIGYAESLRGCGAWREAAALLYALLQWSLASLRGEGQTGAALSPARIDALARATGGYQPAAATAGAPSVLPIGARAIAALSTHGATHPDDAACVAGASALHCCRALTSAGLPAAAVDVAREADAGLHAWAAATDAPPHLRGPAPSCSLPFIAGVSGLPALEALGGAAVAAELARTLHALLWRQAAADAFCGEGASDAGGVDGYSAAVEALAGVPSWAAAVPVATLWLDAAAAAAAAAEAPPLPSPGQSFLAMHLLMQRGDSLVARGQLDTAQQCYEVALAAACSRLAAVLGGPAAGTPATPPPAPALLPTSTAPGASPPPPLPPALSFQVLPSLADVAAAAAMSLSAPLTRLGAGTARSAHHQAAALALDALVRSAPAALLRADTAGVLCGLYEAAVDAAAAARAKRVLQAVAARYGLTHLAPSSFLLLA